MSVATITLIAAIASTVVGVGTFFHFFLMVIRWPRATGTVTGNVAQLRSTDGNEYAHFPRIEFQAASGKTYEVQGDIGLNDEADWAEGRVALPRGQPEAHNHHEGMAAADLFSRVYWFCDCVLVRVVGDAPRLS